MRVELGGFRVLVDEFWNFSWVLVWVSSNYKLKNILSVSRSLNTHLVIKQFGQMPSKCQLFWETKQPQLPENPSQLSYDLRVAENVVMQLNPINIQKSTVMHMLTIFAILFGGCFLGLGNAFFSIDHQSHHGSENPHHTNSEHQTSIQEALPPNCLFCLDGLPPAPGNSYSHLIPNGNLRRTEFSTQITQFDNVHPSSQHQARAPPILVWL